MTSLKSFIKLTEKKEESGAEPKIAVIVFGRFQPPTKGHLKIIHAAQSVANTKGGVALVYPSQTTDQAGRNPLEWDEKIMFMKQLLTQNGQLVDPNIEIVKDPRAKTAWNVIELLDEAGFTEVYLVCGSDRVEEYNKRWLPYAEKAFEKAGVFSAGSRDPDDEKGIQGMSGTKARMAAAVGDLGTFRAATGWDGDIATQMMIAVKKGLPGSR